MNRSIKRFLLIYISLSVLIVYGLISWASYVVSKNELDELYDATLQQVASAIEAQHLAIHDSSRLYINSPVGSHTEIEKEQEFYVRVLAQDGTMLYVSHPEEKVPLPSTLGLSTQRYMGKQWRFFSIQVKNETIQVAQSLKLRQLTIKETAVSLMTSQLVLIPVLVILIFLAISKALRPLSVLSEEIEHRQSLDLKPFATEKIPSEIKPLVNSLNMFMGKVSDTVALLKRFTSDAAHELRTPITALRLQITLVEQAKNKSERDSAIKILSCGITRSEQLISQLLTLARIEPNNQIRKTEAVNLLDLAKESIQEFLVLAQVKSIDLGLNTSSVAMVDGVSHELKVLLSNLVDNAIRYTPNYGKVDIAIFNNEQNITVEVIDSGLGLPESDLQHIFKRFYRGENKDAYGSGLGLSIAKEIATQHHASIEASNLHPGFCIKIVFEV
ncbi:Sensory histidine kinase QseC [Candidatus Nitrotoga sp. BS]|uniref:ATP-binding protein n=1 Tax=Candidatus Nitrotoga sp. BS TaxID=2890408 RepID=UPI001EF2CAE7|nr:ATP-binding protein [Candidatus Nitrotoga sp. BS]CAH1201413.1 Sensory histidine kinase QseC [Candidatus Nitrotoga sp. BS]